ncbi:MAG: N-acetylmuramoyl-L-alanine amidase, partial [Nitrospirota bacterium]
MKKIVFLLMSILFLNTVSGEETYTLKLRTSQHPEFSRIVIEGAGTIISKGIVNQKNRDIVLSFPDSRFVILGENASIPYKINKDSVLFSPGIFHGFKVFPLKNPDRLVIDMFLTERKTGEEKKSAKLSVKLPWKDAEIHETDIVVIDPGHGGYEDGLVKDDYKEKNVSLDVAKRLMTLITRESNQCFITRESDQFMSLEERIKFTNNERADVFLSLHVGKHSNIVLYTPVVNEPGSPELEKFMAYKGQKDFLAKTAALSDAIQKAITENFGGDMVSVKPLPYSILSKIGAAALIIEMPS